MALLTASELACMQATAVGILDQTCTISRDGATTDTWGSPGSGTPTQIGATIACNLGKPTAQMLATYAAKVIGRVAYDVSLPAGTNVQDGDNLTVNGRVLKVEAVLDRQSYLILLHVLAVEVR